MDEKILALIEAGQARIRQAEEDEAYEAAEVQRQIKESWDAVDDVMREALPDALKPYMQPSYREEKPIIKDFPLRKTNSVDLEIPGLAPIRANLARIEGNPDWEVVTYTVADMGWSEW